VGRIPFEILDAAENDGRDCFRFKGGWVVAGLRMGLGYLVAVAVGIVVWKLLGEENVPCQNTKPTTKSMATSTDTGEASWATPSPTPRPIVVLSGLSTLLVIALGIGGYYWIPMIVVGGSY